MDAVEILKEKLVGNFYSRFSVGDTFDFYFDSFWLISHGVNSPDEESINLSLVNDYRPAEEAIDREDIAKSTIIASILRKKIREVSLSSDSALKLVFENGVTLVLPTNTEIVDWHWAINEKATDPYLGCEVGCFSPGEVQVGNC